MSTLEELIDVMARLRAEDGCPWDREQTHATLKPYLLEEAYEVLDAIDSGDDDELIGELGDVLLQVVFHAQIAGEEGRFSIADVGRAIVDKLVRRHPHVFGSVEVEGADHVVTNWERIKREERAQGGKKQTVSALDGVPTELPALLRAQRVQEKAARVGFDWQQIDGALDKIAEEFDEVRSEWEAVSAGDATVQTQVQTQVQTRARYEEEMGDLLFALVNAGRFMGICPEDALRRAVGKFETRFRSLEERFRQRGSDLEEANLEEMDRVWDQVKEDEC